MRNLTDKEKNNLKKKIHEEIKNGTFTQDKFAAKYKAGKVTVRRLIDNDKKLQKEYEEYKNQRRKKQKCSSEEKPFIKEEVERNFGQNTATITTRSLNIKTVEELLKISNVDLTIWEVERHLINSWEVTVGRRNSGTGDPETFTNYQVKVWLKRKEPAVLALEELYEKIKSASPIAPKIKRVYHQLDTGKCNSNRQLEISLFDLHLGLRCFKSAADINWTPDDAEAMTMAMLEKLIELTKSFGPFEKIIFPMGNDFLHTDNVWNTTTSHTPQPEGDAWKSSFLRGELLGLAIMERLKQVAPVKVIVVPGNHARISEIALGRILNAYYHNDDNFEMDANIVPYMSPYKFHHYGVNLIGFEHGHSIRQQVRLAALMANECRLNGWQEARYCEFHCGDQHRKGSGRPMMFEEQGVSIEFLPGLVPPNEWHRIHSYNWQKRAGMAFIWDKTAGCVARFQVNVDNYTGRIMR